MLKKEDGKDIPDYELERLARTLLPTIQKLFESEEGKREFEEWQKRKSIKEND